MMRQIIIDIDHDNSFTVREGDRFADGLGWDEMLGTIAELTHLRLGTARYAMLTKAQWEQRRVALRAAADDQNSFGEPK